MGDEFYSLTYLLSPYGRDEPERDLATLMWAIANENNQ